ncbi:MAG TPA: TetR/AcrR family transcriptional regulator C-terminal domain-containing protein [Acidimicrobiales bacterium]|nr:TetR/AcrR family transcriptional regulator C-terminal domain-containing protein [Acidimicrobiales bacterium]
MALEETQRQAQRGRPRSLTEEGIVKAALKLTASSHLEDVSMRALAQELGVPVMTIYSYVPNREAFYELVTDHVLRTVAVPGPSEGSWEERLLQLERDARAAMRKYPGVKFNRRGGISPEAARLTNGVLSILEDAGFGRAEARLAFASLFTLMVGQIEIDSYDESAASTAVIESVTQTTNDSSDVAFEFALNAVIEGLKILLNPKPPAKSSRRRSR